MENSGVNWTHHSLGFWIGCQHASDGCLNCYAEQKEDHRFHRVKWGPGQPRRRTRPETWQQAFKWNSEAIEQNMRYRVFANPESDTFDNAVDPRWRSDAWAVIRHCQNLDWLILTKRPQNIRKMLPPDWGDHGWPNVWLGTTTENMVEARRRIPILARVPARHHFLSAEPLLEPVNLQPWLRDGVIDWVICGGESGNKYRPMEADWARYLRDQCAHFRTAFFMKQMAARHPMDDMIPPDLMIRQYPT